MIAIEKLIVNSITYSWNTITIAVQNFRIMNSNLENFSALKHPQNKFEDIVQDTAFPPQM